MARLKNTLGASREPGDADQVRNPHSRDPLSRAVELILTAHSRISR